MKRNLAASIGLVILACATGAAAAITTFHTTLRNPGPNEPPGIVACGSSVGGGTLTYDDSSHTLSGTLSFPAPATTAILYGPPSNYLYGLDCGSSPCAINVQLQSTDEPDLLASKDIAFLQSSGKPAVMSGYIVSDDGGIDSCELDSGAPLADAGASADAAVPDAAAADASSSGNELLVASCSAGAGPHSTSGALVLTFAVALLAGRRRARGPRGVIARQTPAHDR